VEVLADVVWPHNDAEEPFTKRELQVSNREEPPDRPQATQSITSSCDNNIFHTLSIAELKKGHISGILYPYCRFV
jgi:hypothetical protein